MDKVVHFEIPFINEKRSKKFYSEIFGWQIVPIPIPGDGTYDIAQTAKTGKNGMIQDKPGSINGALVKKHKKNHPYPILTIQVESIDKKLKEIKKAGGKILEPKMAVMEMGLYALFSDPEGNVTALWENIKKSTNK